MKRHKAREIHLHYNQFPSEVGEMEKFKLWLWWCCIRKNTNFNFKIRWKFIWNKVWNNALKWLFYVFYLFFLDFVTVYRDRASVTNKKVKYIKMFIFIFLNAKKVVVLTSKKYSIKVQISNIKREFLLMSALVSFCWQQPNKMRIFLILLVVCIATTVSSHCKLIHIKNVGS